MTSVSQEHNRLINETSPYLLQHAYNPVNWFPWGEEAFEKARRENKPVFLSVGYSTCHWCHVMAHESFEDHEIAALLNKYFVSIKVDREERPDIDSIYMAFCQAFTGSGGWPTSIFMTPDQLPFFAGTYFPPHSRYGAVGFYELLQAIAEKWSTDRRSLISSAEEITEALSDMKHEAGEINPELIEKAVSMFTKSFDEQYGGFGPPPKFPTPHNLLFLMAYSQVNGNNKALEMALSTLGHMRKGGIFDHIGYGFSRYSTDRYFLAPHFEKMLYDNALLIMAYTAAYAATGKTEYLDTAEKTALYIRNEMTSSEGGFYSAQDADSEGEEGKYYLLLYDEALAVLGDSAGKEFNDYYGITREGNFDGRNIPNRINGIGEEGKMDRYLPVIYEYRSKRTRLNLDDKVLTSWNALMISAFALLYRATGKENYFSTAQAAQQFIDTKLSDENNLFVSYRDGKCSGKGFLDDYAFYAAAMLEMYRATLDKSYISKAEALCREAIKQFADKKNGGFYLNGKDNEKLVIAPKEIYDGAVPSGNSVMAYNFVRLWQLTGEAEWEDAAKQQLRYMSSAASDYPSGHSMFLLSLLLYLNPPPTIKVLSADEKEWPDIIKKLPLYADVETIPVSSEEYKLINGRTTFYVCKGNTCLKPVNSLEEVFK